MPLRFNTRRVAVSKLGGRRVLHKLGGRRVLHTRVAESRYSEVYPPHPNPKVPEPLEGGDEATCVTRGTCFESMTAR
jgi:hypothetical protein